MKMRKRVAPLLLLALSTLPATLADAKKAGSVEQLTKERADPVGEIPLTSPIPKDIGTKDAPVDGLDGKPHAGPFVDTQTKKKLPAGAEDLGPNKPVATPTVADEDLVIPKKLAGMEFDDSGVMRDKDRPSPKKGTTGTEGGVSEKTLAQEQKELAGEVELKKPEQPKEARPLPNGERTKLDEKNGGRIGKENKDDEPKEKKKGAQGLEKPADLPEKPIDIPPPVPPSVPKSGSSSSKQSSSMPNFDDETPEGVIQPFHSFILSLTMILFSEVGDKTFLVAALMAMRHPRLLVFSAALSALIAMTVLSAVLGHAVPTLLPKRLTTFAAAFLFLIFGAKLLREGLAMSPDEGVGEEMAEVEQELEEKEHLARRAGGRKKSDISPYALEAGRGRRSRSNSRLPAPPRSPSTSPSRSPSPSPNQVKAALAGLNNLFSLLLSPAWVQTFVMTFLGEWGDRSQIATIAMASGSDYWWVTLGAAVGHACCTGAAVVGGRAIAGKVSMRVVTLGGAVAFIIFGFIYFAEAMYSE